MRPTSETRPRPIDEHLPRLRRELGLASELLVCLDFDGTLAPIVDDPDEASLTPATEAAVESLASATNVSTAIVSGRRLADVRSRVDTVSNCAGNHGLELVRDGSRLVHPVARERAELVERTCRTLETAVDPIPGCRVENKRLTGTVHVRSVSAAVRPVVRRLAHDVADRIGDGALESSTGKRVIEFAPAISWGKGDAVSLLESVHSEGTFVVYVGDDVTDESAFRAVEPDGLGVRVGDDRPSAASCRVRSPAAVASLLCWLATVGDGLVGESGDRSTRATASKTE